MILAHWLKWQFQLEGRSSSWKGSIFNGRNRIERLFKDQPSLKNKVDAMLFEAYQEALEWAVEETGLNTLPQMCPYCVQQILDKSWLPV